MQITNLTTTVFDLPGLRMHGNETITLANARYTDDDGFREQLNHLYDNGKVSVSGVDGFPRRTAGEDEVTAAGGAENGVSVSYLGGAGAVNADAAVMVVHGTTVNVPVIAAAPPAWLDVSGNIIEAGLYLNGAAILQSVAPTTPGLWARVGGQFFGGTMVALDSLAAGNENLQEMLSVAVADLPFPTGIACAVPADATAVLSVQSFVWRLLT